MLNYTLLCASLHLGCSVQPFLLETNLSAFPKLRDASGQQRISIGLQRFFKLLIPNWDTGNFLFVLVLKKYLPFCG